MLAIAAITNYHKCRFTYYTKNVNDLERYKNKGNYAAAMKYVTLFRCRDFFIDETITPPEKSSPFVKLYFTEEKKEAKEAKETKEAKEAKIENSPFAKFRNYAKENPNEKTGTSGTYGNVSKMVTQKDEKTTDEKEPEKMKNKFLYLGKINNFTMTQFVEKKRKVLAKFTSPLLENIKIDANVQKEQISYKDFKKYMNTSQKKPDE